MKLAIAIIAALLALVGNVSYVRDVVRGTVRPHPYSWFIWSIVTLVNVFGVFQKGGGFGVIPTAVSEGFTVVIFFLALFYMRRNGLEKIKTEDHIYLVVALAALIPWYITRDPTISIIIVVCMDLVAFIPTLRKTYREPESEKPLLFATNASRHILTIFALSTYNLATMLHSSTMILVNALMVVLIFRKK